MGHLQRPLVDIKAADMAGIPPPDPFLPLAVPGRQAGWGGIVRGTTPRTGTISSTCAPKKGPSTEVALMFAERITHNEMVLIKILTDHLLQFLQEAGLL